MIEEGGGSLTKNFAVNVMGPLLLTRLLVPALSAAQPVGNVQVSFVGVCFCWSLFLLEVFLMLHN